MIFSIIDIPSLHSDSDFAIIGMLSLASCLFSILFSFSSSFNFSSISLFSESCCFFLTNSFALFPETNSILTTPSCILFVFVILISSISEVFATCVPPHASISKSPIDTILTDFTGTTPPW